MKSNPLWYFILKYLWMTYSLSSKNVSMRAIISYLVKWKAGSLGKGAKWFFNSEPFLSQSAIHLKINELNFCLILGGQMVCIGAQCMSQLSVWYFHNINQIFILICFVNRFTLKDIKQMSTEAVRSQEKKKHPIQRMSRTLGVYNFQFWGCRIKGICQKQN